MLLPALTTPDLTITGAAAVSAAGWNISDLAEAVSSQTELHIDQLPGHNSDQTFPVRRVPKADPDPRFRHPRLRRTSPVTRFAIHAALDALGAERVEQAQSGKLRVGVIFTLINGCVNFTNRFFSEVLTDPSTASPILFPETVFNAPASHLSSYLGSRAINYTLMGDTAQFLAAFDVASLWLDADQADCVVIVGTEEVDWLTAGAIHRFHPTIPSSEGAGAVCLTKSAANGAAAKVTTLTHPLSIFNWAEREPHAAATATALRPHLPTTGTTTIIDGRIGDARHDQAETAAWAPEQAAGIKFISPLKTIGHPLGGANAIQTALAAHLVITGKTNHAIATATGHNQQVLAALFSGTGHRALGIRH